MQKPDYDPMDVMRAMTRVEQNIRVKEEAIRREEEKRSEFESWIERHERWRENGQKGKKPMYRESALRDGVVEINANIRRIRESIQNERQQIQRLEYMLESYRRYQKHVEEQAALVEKTK